jgi:hypothetical protein
VCREQTWSTATGCRVPVVAGSLQSTTSKLLNLRTHNPGAADPLHSHAGDIAYWPVTADGERRRCLPVPVALPGRLALSTASMAVHPFRTCEPRGSACVHVSPSDFAALHFGAAIQSCDIYRHWFVERPATSRRLIHRPISLRLGPGCLPIPLPMHLARNNDAVRTLFAGAASYAAIS